MDILAITISALALVLSIAQYVLEGNRLKNESTLRAYNELQKEVFPILKKYKKMDSIQPDTPEWNEITSCLAKIENFCVGINSKMYSIRILNRLGGGFFIEQRKRLTSIIMRKRASDKSMKHYDEYDRAAKNLCKLRGEPDCLQEIREAEDRENQRMEGTES